MSQRDLRLAAALALASHINPSSTSPSRSNSNSSDQSKNTQTSPTSTVLNIDEVDNQTQVEKKCGSPEPELRRSNSDLTNLELNPCDHKLVRSGSFQAHDASMFRDAAHKLNQYQKTNQGFCRDPSELWNDPEIRQAMARACDVMQSPEALAMMRQCASKARRDAAKSQTLYNPASLPNEKNDKRFHAPQTYSITKGTLDTPPASWVDEWNPSYSTDTISTCCNKSRESPCYF